MFPRVSYEICLYLLNSNYIFKVKLSKLYERILIHMSFDKNIIVTRTLENQICKYISLL